MAIGGALLRDDDLAATAAVLRDGAQVQKERMEMVRRGTAMAEKTRVVVSCANLGVFYDCNCLLFRSWRKNSGRQNNTSLGQRQTLDLAVWTV
jgi:hypothetical protein